MLWLRRLCREVPEILHRDDYRRLWLPHANGHLDVCIGCGGCDSVCPAMGERPKDGAQSVLWAKSRDRGERLASSSGGVFGLLALDVLADGGVVCGAAWDEGCRHGAGTCSLKTGQISIPSCVPSRCRSSVGRKAYEGVREALRGGRRVLFSGTACQVAGMRSYLGKLADSDGFLSVDVICHGVPSPLLWEKWAAYKEVGVGAALRAVNMRSKATGWLSYSGIIRVCA